MSTILDHEEKPIKVDPKSMKSIRYFIYSLVLLLIVLLLFFLYNNSDLRYLGFVFAVLALIFVVSSLLGFKNVVQSLLVKESWSVIKVIGLIGNFITFGTSVSFVFLNVQDVLWWYNGN